MEKFRDVQTGVIQGVPDGSRAETPIECILLRSVENENQRFRYVCRQQCVFSNTHFVLWSSIFFFELFCWFRVHHILNSVCFCFN